ncbi:MAG TPA: hypothetical protein VJU87_12120 [Gemmatimonadaceae bacterium]|nr:hypothetical protein [Gemmatimonadaceae bacterium]
MPEDARVGLRVVDAFRLDRAHRNALLPGATLSDPRGHARTLPRYFYEIPSWEAALDVALAPHFHLWEFVHTDVREAEPLRFFPRYVPCAVTLLAMCLEHFRDAVGTPVRIAANGGYRSPRHQLTCQGSTHCWASAVNIYSIGDTHLDTRQEIEHFAAIARAELPGVWVRPYGSGAGCADDHLHLDLGYVVAVPHGAPGDPYNPKLESEPL